MIRTGNKQIVSRAKRVRSPIAQAFGLMFRKKLVDEGWVFEFAYESYWHITNVFVFQTIDVLWLDAAGAVLQIRTITPFTVHCAGIAGTKTVIELPQGTARKAKIKVGDVVTWSF